MVKLFWGMAEFPVPKMAFRPFRTSAIALSLILLGMMWLVLEYDLKLAGAIGETANAVVNTLMDVSVVMVAFTGIVTSINKLSDDGGETDVIKLAKIQAKERGVQDV